MLNTVTAPFPDVGARALLIEAHRFVPVKILQDFGGRGRKRRLLISIPSIEGSSGNRRVTEADLVTAEPLTEAEEAELLALERELSGQSRPLAAKAKRHEQLRLRAVHHEEEREKERVRQLRETHPYTDRRLRA